MLSSVLPLTEQSVVREQLDRILANHLFRNSKRFPDFLRYTVEHALNGNTEDIKERTLGIEVFGRAPDYDTSMDPVVRMTAAEVRKRLAQYYQTPGHEHETRIDFPLRSYVPEFRFPATAPVSAPPQAVQAMAAKPTRQSLLVIAVLFSCTLVCAFIWTKLPARENALDRFWGPVDASSSPVLICLPDLDSPHLPSVSPAPPDPLAPTISSLPAWFRRDRVSFGDSLALALLTSVFGSKRHAFHVRRADDAQLQDLQEGPVVLIGGLSNPWTIQLDSELRFTFVHDGNVRYIRDRENPGSRQWSVLGLMHDSGAKITQDYGLISRVFDPTTGHPLIASAGIFQYGTEAAAQCLTDQGCLEKAEKLNAGDWKHKNVQIVIGTTIIGENAGQPRVLAAYLW